MTGRVIISQLNIHESSPPPPLSMCGRYASSWNAFLFNHIMDPGFSIRESINILFGQLPPSPRYTICSDGLADPGFSRGGGANTPGRGDRQHTILLNLPKNFMKLKEFGPDLWSLQPSQNSCAKSQINH